MDEKLKLLEERLNRISYYQFLSEILGVYTRFVGKNYLVFLKELDKLVNLYFEVGKEFPLARPKDEDYKKVNLDIEFLLNDFFSTIDPSLVERYQAILRYEKNENGLYKNILKAGGNAIEVTPDGRLIIETFDGTIKDAVFLLHELVHKFSTPFLQRSFMYKWFAEVPSVTFEFLFWDYVREKYPFLEEEVLNCIRYRICYVTEVNAMNVLVNNTLFQCYEEHRRINAEILFRFVESLPSSLKKDYFIENLDAKVLSCVYTDFRRDFSYQYLLALFVAFDFRERIAKCPEEKNKLLSLLHILGDSDFEIEENLKVLRTLDLPVIGKEVGKFDDSAKFDFSLDRLHLLDPLLYVDDNFIKIDENNYERMKKSYKKVLNDISTYRGK